MTREPFERQGRLTTLIETGQIFADNGLDQTRFDPEHDRVMLCGSMEEMIKDLAALCEAHGHDLPKAPTPSRGTTCSERAFVG